MKLRAPFILLLIALLITLAGCGAKASTGIDWKIDITGAVDKPITVTYDDMAGMKQTTLQNVLMRKSRGQEQTNSWEGVPVNDVLNKAKVQSAATGITVIATDGYAIQVPKADLDKSIIALKMDGKLVKDEGKGAVRLVVPDKPANFWVAGVIKMNVETGEIFTPTPRPDNSPTAAAAPTVAPTPTSTPEPTSTPTPAPTPTTGETPTAAAAAALAIKGLVSQELSLSLDDLRAMEQVKVTAETKKGKEDFQGVLVPALLQKAGVKPEGKSVSITGADGYQGAADLASVMACKDCIVAIGDDGKLSTVLPGQPKKSWVQDAVSIEVQDKVVEVPSATAASSATSASSAGGKADLVITGLVSQELDLTIDQLRKMDVQKITAEFKDQTNDYEGISLNALLEKAGVKAEVTTLAFKASDDYTAEAPLADVQACKDCLVSFQKEKGLAMVMPGMATNLWVRDIISIEAK